MKKANKELKNQSKVVKTSFTGSNITKYSGLNTVVKYMNHQNIVKSISSAFPTRWHNASKFGVNQILSVCPKSLFFLEIVSYFKHRRLIFSFATILFCSPFSLSYLSFDFSFFSILFIFTIGHTIDFIYQDLKVQEAVETERVLKQVDAVLINGTQLLLNQVYDSIGFK